MEEKEEEADDGEGEDGKNNDRATRPHAGRRVHEGDEGMMDDG